MANRQRVEEEIDTEQEMDSEQDNAKAVEGEETEEDLTKFLEPLNKEQLIDIIRSVSTKNREIIEEIQKRADQDPSHCELFVRGLSWETTSDQLKEIFSAYGEIRHCNVVVDKYTGKSKGYGFILYKHGKSASKALREPLKNIGDRMLSCRLNSNQQHQQKKISVRNVDSKISIMKLYSYFLKHGEIEAGPFGFDKYSGKFNGYASFIYKSAEGARRALEEPVKRFDGYTLYCQMTGDDKQKFGLSGVGGCSPYAGVGAGFNTQNGVAQTYGQGIHCGASQPYGRGIFSGAAQPYGQGTEHVQAALSVLAAAGQNPSALSVMNLSVAGFSPDSVSPTTSQQGTLGAFGKGNPVCQNPQSHQLNTWDQIAPKHGPAKRPGLGYYLRKLGLFFVLVVGILFLLTIIL